MPVDRRAKLDEEPFDVTVANGKVIVRFRGRIVRVLTGATADSIAELVNDGDHAAVQLFVARKTGNFKRGNERWEQQPIANLTFWSRWAGMIRRPTVYETVALPLSYIGLTAAQAVPQVASMAQVGNKCAMGEFLRLTTVRKMSN
jgi:hypothetical protein